MNIEQELILEEGLRLTPYKDSLGNWTAGVGHLIQSDIGDITLKLAGEWLAEDISIAKKELINNFDWFYSLSENRQYVLISMCFNLGITRLKKFKKFLSACERGDYQKAGDEMIDSLWYKQVGLRGKKLSDIMKTDKLKG